jgi:hypothetical protein
MGLVPGALLWNPGKARAAKDGARNLMRRLELDVLKSSRPKKSPSITQRTEGSETSLYQTKGGKKSLLCTMNPTGKTIWEACNGRRTYREITGLIRKRYQVTPDRAETDILTFLELLKDMGAIIL